MPETDEEARQRLARRLTAPGGSGGPGDVAAVATAAARLPRRVLDFLRRKGARIIACRGSITDHRAELRGVVPRGWPPDKTWDIVPGVYMPTDKEVVIATRPGPAGTPIVPPRGPDSHGSHDLALHEAMHGHDFLKKHKLINRADFQGARLADFAALGSYEQQAGEAGLQETWAESAARAFGADPAFPAAWPNLAGYWAGLPPAVLESVAAAQSASPAGPPAIGTALLAKDGAILLDLRADGPGGAIGHAALRVEPAYPLHARLSERLFGPGVAAESAASTPVLVPAFD